MLPVQDECQGTPRRHKGLSALSAALVAYTGRRGGGCVCVEGTGAVCLKRERREGLVCVGRGEMRSDAALQACALEERIARACLVQRASPPVTCQSFSTPLVNRFFRPSPVHACPSPPLALPAFQKRLRTRMQTRIVERSSLAHCANTLMRHLRGPAWPPLVGWLERRPCACMLGTLAPIALWEGVGEEEAVLAAWVNRIRSRSRLRRVPIACCVHAVTVLPHLRHTTDIKRSTISGSCLHFVFVTTLSPSAASALLSSSSCPG